MSNVMPTTAPVLDRREMGRARSLTVAAAALLAALGNGHGEWVALSALTARLWAGGGAHCRHDSGELVKALGALCEGTGVKLQTRVVPGAGVAVRLTY